MIPKLSLQKQIGEETQKLSDKELFTSKEYAAYLENIAKAATSRYDSGLRVLMQWDDSPQANAAYTDFKTITINAANSYSQSFPSRSLRSGSLVGLTGHEIGHLLYTDYHAKVFYLKSLKAGRFYPALPDELDAEAALSLDEIKQVFDDNDTKTIGAIVFTANQLRNILEDVYIEARMCAVFQGTLKTGILLNAICMKDQMPSIQQQLDDGLDEYYILINLLLTYARYGIIKNEENYSGTLIDVMEKCLSCIDTGTYSDDAKDRFSAVNQIVLFLWPYILEMKDKLPEEKEKLPMEDVIKKLLEMSEGKLKGMAPEAVGMSAEIAVMGSGKFHYNREMAHQDMQQVQEILDIEGGRIPLIETGDIDIGADGVMEWRPNYAGAGYAQIERDMERVQEALAKMHAVDTLGQELKIELQKHANNIAYGDAHRGIKVVINRITVVPENLKQAFAHAAAPYLHISRLLQNQISQLLMESHEGGRLNGLLMGKRISMRSYARMDGKIFCNDKLPAEKGALAFALLVDESGSMSSSDRATYARAAAITL